jgi:V/A-type H+-transporting ATPase subunit A
MSRAAVAQRPAVEETPAQASPGVTATGRVVAAAGPVVRATDLPAVTVGEVVRVGPRRLFGEVIDLEPGLATIQVYEETVGLRIGDPVESTAAPLRVWLGPGLLGATLDGLQRPLATLAAAGPTLAPGLEAPALDPARTWAFTPGRRPGEEIGPGDILGTVPEGTLEHRILVPPHVLPGRLLALDRGHFTVHEPIGRVATAAGEEELHLAHPWPVRAIRPSAARLGAREPLATGQRVLDMLFPVARGGTAIVPGGFGTGKTVVEQALARWSDADVVVFVGCGERGNEMAGVLAEFAELVDPRTGGPLLARSILVANTSNMPVAAREASVQVGATIAEYFRDQGYAVALLADSTSRWAEAMREISGRLEELPGEEGFPAYLPSRLAHFYERAGRVTALGSPERSGSLTIVGAISPPGGDFSEPVTQASLRLTGTFWALDTELAHARHFPAIGWTQSYSLYVDPLTAWYREEVGADWDARRREAIALLARERELLEIVQLVGPDALPDEDRVVLEAARLLREVFLQQHAFDPVDAARPPRVQFAMLRAVLAARAGLSAATAAGVALDEAVDAPLLRELRRIKEWSGEDVEQRLTDLATRLTRWETGS